MHGHQRFVERAVCHLDHRIRVDSLVYVFDRFLYSLNITFPFVPLGIYDFQAGANICLSSWYALSKRDFGLRNYSPCLLPPPLYVN